MTARPDPDRDELIELSMVLINLKNAGTGTSAQTELVEAIAKLARRINARIVQP